MGWMRSRRLIVTLLVAVCLAGATIAIAHAQQMVVQGVLYRLCLRVSEGGGEPFLVLASLSQDLKGNYKLSGWTEGKCR